MNTTYKRNEPLYFQKKSLEKKPLDFHSKPNATFLRDLGEVHGEPVCEIEREEARWIVRYSEIKSQKEHLDDLRQEWFEAVEAAKKSILPKTTKGAIAAALGISTSTLRNRMQFLGEV